MRYTLAKRAGGVGGRRVAVRDKTGSGRQSRPQLARSAEPEGLYFSLQFAPMEFLFIILGTVAVFAWVVGRVASRRGVGTRSRSKADALVTACLGDRGKAQRLVEYEKRRAPTIGYAEARRRALERLTVDRGR